MTRTKVSVVHLLPAPYRLPLFERMMKDEQLDVRLFFTDSPSSNRPTWSQTKIMSDERVVKLHEMGIPPLKRGEDKMRINFGLSRILEHNPDLVLVYGHNEMAPLSTAIMCIFHNTPYVLISEVSNGSHWSYRRRLLAPLLSLVVQKASWLAPASRSCAKFFEELGGDSTRMTIVPCVPDVEALASKAKELSSTRDAIKEKNGLDGRFVLLFVGRLVEHKGVKELLHAMEEIHRNNPRVCLVIIGYGPLEPYVREECDKLGNAAKLIGFVDDDTLREFYSIADLHIMPSWDEPFGVVCAEALSFGVPSIVTDTSGCIDLLVDGANGYIIKPRSPHEIVDRVMRISTDKELLADMKSEARASMSNLTMERLYPSLKDVIASTLKSSHHNSPLT